MFAQEKVTKEKGTPTSGSGGYAARLPSFRCRSGGRHEGTSLSLRSSLGVLPRAPLRNTSTRPPDGDSVSELPGGFSLRFAHGSFSRYARYWESKSCSPDVIRERPNTRLPDYIRATKTVWRLPLSRQRERDSDNEPSGSTKRPFRRVSGIVA